MQCEVSRVVRRASALARCDAFPSAACVAKRVVLSHAHVWVYGGVFDAYCFNQSLRTRCFVPSLLLCDAQRAANAYNFGGRRFRACAALFFDYGSRYVESACFKVAIEQTTLECCLSRSARCELVPRRVELQCCLSVESHPMYTDHAMAACRCRLPLVCCPMEVTWGAFFLGDSPRGVVAFYCNYSRCVSRLTVRLCFARSDVAVMYSQRAT